jgi:hypothetical protein
MRHDTSVPVCPRCCKSYGTFLVTLSTIAYADYFQCSDCNHVWSTTREACLESAEPQQSVQGRSVPGADGPRVDSPGA